MWSDSKALSFATDGALRMMKSLVIVNTANRHDKLAGSFWMDRVSLQTQKIQKICIDFEVNYPPIRLKVFYFPLIKYGKYWVHLQKKIIANFHVLGLFITKKQV
jgi:hypothetical protein